MDAELEAVWQSVNPTHVQKNETAELKAFDQAHNCLICDLLVQLPTFTFWGFEKVHGNNYIAVDRNQDALKLQEETMSPNQTFCSGARGCPFSQKT